MWMSGNTQQFPGEEQLARLRGKNLSVLFEGGKESMWGWS